MQDNSDDSCLLSDRFVNCIAKHPDLQTDPSFVDFLEVDGDLPRATSTSALSGAGVLRLFSRVGDSFGKMTYKMDESDTVITLVIHYACHDHCLYLYLSVVTLPFLCFV